MTRLCSRPEGLARTSEYHSLPTQCFFDVILIPLCTWVYFLLAILLSRAVIRKPLLDWIPAYQHKSVWSFLPIMLGYYLFLCTIIALTSFEIAGLSQLSLGIGLLPFALAGLLLAGLSHLSPPPRRFLPNHAIANVVFFAMSFAMTIAKQNALGKLPEELERAGTSFSLSKQRTALGVVLGFYASLISLEVSLAFHKSPVAKSSAQSKASRDDVAEVKGTNGVV